MTDLTFPPSARRFAALLDRGYCVWMPSPSVAVLSALVTGKGRPKRLLVPENAPAFISNIGRVAGATAVKVAPDDIDAVLHGLLRTEGLNPEHVWGVATHRDGKLSPTDWLSRCAASGVPTIELCLGSFVALARWGPSPATFTIVDLDAEEAFAGAHLTALLTSDRGLAARVQELCLPSPEARDYIFDAWPRGLAHDEPALVSMVEGAMAQGGEQAQAANATPAFTLPWARRFQPVESLAAVEKERWSARLAEAEARHTEAIRAAVANASLLQSRLEQQLSLADEWQRRGRAAERDAASRAEQDSALLSESQRRLDQQQRIIDQWEARFGEAESEAATDAAILNKARADLLEQRSESERALASMWAESESLAQKLLRAERERDLAVVDAARRDESERTTLSQLRERVAQFERAAAVSAEREAREATQASRTLLSARVARLEADAVVLGKERADLLQQKAEAEQTLTAIKADREALTRKLSDLDAELGEALADAAKGTAVQRVALDEQTQRAARLEREVAALTSREATKAREWEASRAEWSERIASLEASARQAAPPTALLLTQKAEKEPALASLVRESEALAHKLAAVQNERDRALADAASREGAQRAAMDGQRRRAELFEEEVAAHKEREARLVEDAAISRAGLLEKMSRMEAAASEKLAEAERGRLEAAAALLSVNEAGAHAWEPERTQMSERIARLEATAVAASKAHTDLVARKAEGDRALAAARAESEALAKKLAGIEKDHHLAMAAASEREHAQGLALSLERQRADQLERDAAALVEREAKLSREWEASAAEWSERVRPLEAAAAAAAAREARQIEAGEALRVELMARIARLEAGEVIADKARSELLNRKRESDQARAAAQAERAALLKKLAGAEHDRDQAQAVAAGLEADREKRKARSVPTAPLDAQGAAGPRNTGGLSAIVSLWNTAVIGRPSRSKAPEEKPSDPPVKEVLDIEVIQEVIQEEAPPSKDPAPILKREGQDESEHATQGDRMLSLKRVASDGARNTGGLSALVSLWNTAATMRPFRRKVIEEKPPAPPVNEPFEYEGTAKEPVPSSEAAPTQEGEGQRKPDRPAPGGPARPNPPRRPEPKPAPTSDKAQESGGWLRGLARRMRRKE